MMMKVMKTANLDPQHGQAQRTTSTHAHLLFYENAKDGGGIRASWSCPVSENDGVKAKQ
jgi:hypothetical protein